MGTDSLNAGTTRMIWAAGFLDGEGHFSSHRSSPEISVAQVNPAPLLVLANHFACGKVSPHSKKQVGRNHRRAWRWRVYGHNAQNVAALVLPYLIAKREEAEAVVHFYKYGMNTELGTVLRSRAMEKRHKEYVLWQ